MAYVITQNCCKDASCIAACPVDCIRPAEDDGTTAGTQMLFIDPETCIDCGACAEECPVDAIYSEYDLPPEMARFAEINAAYFRHHPLEPGLLAPLSAPASLPRGALRVAVVGAGPAACYAAAGLLEIGGVEVDVFERLPTPYGLIRAGVAPDHQRTKSVVRIFDQAFADSRFGCHLNVEIGRDLTHADLFAHHHAVIYAVGASASRDLDIPGEQLPGHHAAADFVGWYNGHPDHVGHVFDLSGERAVIVGNGNVALDVARVLLMDRDALLATDIADHALEALAQSRIEEVVVLGRRGPREAACSLGEFHALGHLPGIDVIIDGGDLEPNADDDVETTLKLELAREFAERPHTPGNKRIVFRFLSSPTEIVGTERTEGLRVVRNSPDGESEVIETSLVLRSIGYKGRSVDGLPYDAASGTVPHAHGRVVDGSGAPLPGVYVTGWIKRGPRGVIGTNRACAAETVASLLEDFRAGTLDRAIPDRAAFEEQMAARGSDAVDWKGWRAIDAMEKQRGTAASRPRVKFVSVEEMVATARR
ncbi:FAD-dependent oxidoreductase [Nocardia bovistercoris]|uniref:ferredoxin--NADP(+) reductase n=1 Tax=Nocardia bovistercoris TaxID=2785916 RepID=A0A931N7V0_9NOCA|nr:FAD-dependent oxidoreductase [Nocardia bovistercoris]MBH0781118.1 FAD-dependent oxidoreductase [Nocardia bovistercoris]